jgi:hypothetical protein
MATRKAAKKKSAKRTIKVSDLRARKSVKGGLKITDVGDPPPPKK